MQQRGNCVIVSFIVVAGHENTVAVTVQSDDIGPQHRIRFRAGTDARRPPRPRRQRLFPDQNHRRRTGQRGINPVSRKHQRRRSPGHPLDISHQIDGGQPFGIAAAARIPATLPLPGRIRDLREPGLRRHHHHGPGPAAARNTQRIPGPQPDRACPQHQADRRKPADLPPSPGQTHTQHRLCMPPNHRAGQARFPWPGIADQGRFQWTSRPPIRIFPPALNSQPESLGVAASTARSRPAFVVSLTRLFFKSHSVSAHAASPCSLSL